MRNELRNNWGGWLVLVLLFGVLPAIAIWDNLQHPYPEVAQQWQLEDGTICRTFRGQHGVTCVR